MRGSASSCVSMGRLALLRATLKRADAARERQRIVNEPCLGRGSSELNLTTGIDGRETRESLPTASVCALDVTAAR
eukprot:397567-Prymnesium_polylepis.1